MSETQPTFTLEIAKDQAYYGGERTWRSTSYVLDWCIAEIERLRNRLREPPTVRCAHNHGDLQMVAAWTGDNAPHIIAVKPCAKCLAQARAKEDGNDARNTL